MNEIEIFLQSLGLENMEARIYITALGYGPVAASILATKLDIPRSTARYSCDQLVKKGLMLESKKANTKLYTAENPTKLSSILYDREVELRNKRTKLTAVTQILQNIKHPDAKLPEVIYYSGEDGVAKMFSDIAQEKGALYTFGAGDYFLEKLPNMIDKFRKTIWKSDEKIYIIRSPKYRSLHDGKDGAQYETRYFNDIEDLKVDIQMRDDFMSITSIEDNHPIGIKIKHREIVEEFKKIFMETWKNSDM